MQNLQGYVILWDLGIYMVQNELWSMSKQFELFSLVLSQLYHLKKYLLHMLLF